MTTRRLLWGMTWRGTVCGLLTGSVGGAGFGLIAALGYWLMSFWTGKRLPGDVNPRDLSHSIIVLINIGEIATVIAIIIGTIFGFMVGTSGGLMVGILTRVWFFPLRDVNRYRRIIRISSIFLAIGVWFLVFIRLQIPYDLGSWILTGFIPAMVIAACAWLVTPRGIHWYETLMKRENTNT